VAIHILFYSQCVNLRRIHLGAYHAQATTRHRASTSTRWHFAFGAMLSRQRNPSTDCKSAQQCTTRGHPLLFPWLTSGSVQ